MSSTGAEANSFSAEPSISADGRFVAFRSNAANLVADDTNNADDIFIKDMLTGAISRVSTDNLGDQANGDSSSPAISADGRYVAFQTNANNLMAGDNQTYADIYVKDTQTGIITRVSSSSSGVGANLASTDPSISANGRYVAFRSIASNLVNGDTNTDADIFVKDMQTGITTRVSTDRLGAQVSGSSFEPSISADGQYVVFSSLSNDLVANDGFEGHDIFVKDWQTGAIRRITSDNAGGPANEASLQSAISADGHYITFLSLASNLVAVDENGASDIFTRGNPLVSHLRDLHGPSGAVFDIDSRGKNAGQLVQGDNNVFDGLNRLRVANVDYDAFNENAMDDNEQTLITANFAMSGLSVHREVTVPASGAQDFARTIDVFTNSTAGAITVPVRLLGNLGSDEHTTVFATSDGDLIVEPTDSWFATDDAEPNGGTPAVVHWLTNAGALSLQPTNVELTGDNVDWTFNLTVPAGGHATPGDLYGSRQYSPTSARRSQYIIGQQWIGWLSRRVLDNR